MDLFLRGLLRDLEHRCSILLDRLVSMPDDRDTRGHVELAREQIEVIRERTVTLLADPSLGVEALLRNHLHSYGRWRETLDAMEGALFPIIERFGDHDRRLTALCRQLGKQIHWPFPSTPVVCAMSSQYYVTQPGLDLVALPPAEDAGLLGLPDLPHELGHHLLFHREEDIFGGFLEELAAYVDDEKRRVHTEGRSTDLIGEYDRLYMGWRQRWVYEFGSDVIATYLVGPAYAWQHVRLCAGSRRETAYRPSFGEIQDHPADEARLDCVVEALRLMDGSEVAGHVRALWEKFVGATGEERPVDYDLCYPPQLLRSLSRQVVQGCRNLGLRSFAEHSSDSSETQIPSLFNEAWDRFQADPDSYSEWESVRVPQLWQELGFVDREI